MLGKYWGTSLKSLGYLKEQFKFRFQGCATGCEPGVSYSHGLKVILCAPVIPVFPPENSSDFKLQ